MFYDFQIVKMAGDGYGYYVDRIGWGIWTGLTFCLSGGIGLIGSVRPSHAR